MIRFNEDRYFENLSKGGSDLAPRVVSQSGTVIYPGSSNGARHREELKQQRGMPQAEPFRVFSNPKK